MESVERKLVNMGVVWVLEARSSHVELSSFLQGDFAVRMFASYESLKRIAEMKQTLLPQVLLLSECCSDDICSKRDWHLPDRFAAIPQLLFRTQGTLLVIEGGRCAAASLNWEAGKEDCLGLVQRIQREMDYAQQAADSYAQLYRYKTLTLNFDEMSLSFAEDETVYRLTLTEARILRFFLRNIGSCLTRERIKAEVWQGAAVSVRTIDAHVSRLRKYLKYVNLEITAVYGGGYMMHAGET
jgi:hypothetical protein